MNCKEFLVITRSAIKKYSKDDVGILAAGLTYYFFFSLFPLLLLMVTLASFIFNKADAESYILTNVARVAPSTDLAKMIQDIVTNTFKSRANAGLLLIVGVGTLAFAASNAFETLDKAINRAWDAEKRPNFFVGKLISFAMILGVVLLLILSFVVSIVLVRTQSITNSVVGKVPGSEIFWNVADFGASLSLVFLVFVLMYRVLPRCDVKFRDVWLAALLAAVAWTVVKQAFAAYLGSSFANYNAVYGTMGTVIALLTWIYISSVIILFGAEFASETYQIRTMRAQVTGQAGKDQQSKDSPWFSMKVED